MSDNSEKMRAEFETAVGGEFFLQGGELIQDGKGDYKDSRAKTAWWAYRHRQPEIDALQARNNTLDFFVNRFCAGMEAQGVTDMDDPAEAIECLVREYKARIAELEQQLAGRGEAENWGNEDMSSAPQAHAAPLPAPAPPEIGGWLPMAKCPREKWVEFGTYFDGPHDWRTSRGYLTFDTGAAAVERGSWAPVAWRPLDAAISGQAPAGGE